MKVRDVMTKQVAFCGPDTNLDQAVKLMRKNACVHQKADHRKPRVPIGRGGVSHQGRVRGDAEEAADGTRLRGGR